MTIEIFLPDLGSTLAGVFALQRGAFVEAASMSSEAMVIALAIVFAAGLSEAIAQSIVLFANRVRPARFFFSWAIDATLFVFGYVFLVISTWAACRLPGAPHLSLLELALVLAVSYAPLLFSFLGAMPFLGPGILTALRIWHLLAMIVGISAVGRVGFLPASGYVALGWVVMVLAQRSFGKPIALLGTRILNAVAGVALIDDEQLILGRAIASEKRKPVGGGTMVALGKRLPSRPKLWKVVLGLCGVGVLAVLVSAALHPLRGVLFGWEVHLPHLLRFPIELLWLGILAFVVSALMAPLETLGWWAGWYGDRIDTTVDAAPSDIETFLVAVAAVLALVVGADPINLNSVCRV